MSERAAEVAKRTACLGVKFEPSVRSEHQDRRGAEWVLRGEEDAEVVESSYKLCTSGTTNGAVPFLGLTRSNKNNEMGAGDSRICRPEIKTVNVCLGGRRRWGRPRAARQCNLWIRHLPIPLPLGGFSSQLRIRYMWIGEEGEERGDGPELFLLR